MGMFDLVRGLLPRPVDEPDPPLPGAYTGVLEPWHRKPGGRSSGIELEEPENFELVGAVAQPRLTPR